MYLCPPIRGLSYNRKKLESHNVQYHTLRGFDAQNRFAVSHTLVLCLRLVHRKVHTSRKGTGLGDFIADFVSGGRDKVRCVGASSSELYLQLRRLYELCNYASSQ